MELKSCPFCGGQAETDSTQGYMSISEGRMRYQSAIYCTGSCSATMTLCHADVPHMTPEECLQVLVENWNRRSPTVDRRVNPMMQVMRCDSGKHELALLKSQCPFCEIESLRSVLEDIASGDLGVNLCVKYANKALERRAPQVTEQPKC